MVNYTIDTFLQCETPDSWLKAALNNIPLLLLDHAHCEKKAAATALSLINRYSNKSLLLHKMSRLSREELRHFEQVLVIIEGRGERFRQLKPGRYIASLYQLVTPYESMKLIDSLILGAFIEARSCERFRLLSDYLEPELATFYRKLYLAEARHFQEYLLLAAHFAEDKLDERILFFGQHEAKLILEKDAVFRFHSGVPEGD
ncbi:MAG: tRNA-(ms[2]io[6]A)-hydroxylase [Gammaproteobacteria bacterium]|nr:tRNA-(ms[2]io[6]A)-hydroxylase [Gammaproteobacteria bacterium]